MTRVTMRNFNSWMIVIALICSGTQVFWFTGASVCSPRRSKSPYT
jgi:hypothetical protein